MKMKSKLIKTLRKSEERNERNSLDVDNPFPHPQFIWDILWLHSTPTRTNKGKGENNKRQKPKSFSSIFLFPVCCFSLLLSELGTSISMDSTGNIFSLTIFFLFSLVLLT